MHLAATDPVPAADALKGRSTVTERADDAVARLDVVHLDVNVFNVVKAGRFANDKAFNIVATLPIGLRERSGFVGSRSKVGDSRKGCKYCRTHDAFSSPSGLSGGSSNNSASSAVLSSVRSM